MRRRTLTKESQQTIKTTASVPKSIDDDERSVKVVVTAEVADRDGDVVLSKGLDFSDYEKNPVVLFHHDRKRPIGRMMWTSSSAPGRVEGKIQFAKTAAGDEAFQLCKDGALSGISIGMLGPTVKSRRITESDILANPSWAGAERLIESASVLEVSMLTTPACPDALVKTAGRGTLEMVARREPCVRLVKRHLVTRVQEAQPPRVRRLNR